MLQGPSNHTVKQSYDLKRARGLRVQIETSDLLQSCFFTSELADFHTHHQLPMFHKRALVWFIKLSWLLLLIIPAHFCTVCILSQVFNKRCCPVHTEYTDSWQLLFINKTGFMRCLPSMPLLLHLSLSDCFQKEMFFTVIFCL